MAHHDINPCLACAAPLPPDATAPGLCDLCEAEDRAARCGNCGLALRDAPPDAAPRLCLGCGALRDRLDAGECC